MTEYKFGDRVEDERIDGLRYASVCDGIGAAHVAWQPLGWQCAWTSEIEPFTMEVVEQRWGFPNLGDMTRITDEQLERHAPIDILVGGTPCQSFSVAGLRKGLADPRGNLALVYLGLVERTQPQWVVWENVPGVLSSGRGRDFGAFLGALGQLGYGFAYRVLDAQYVRTNAHPRAICQPRRRVFCVGHRGGDWTRPAAVLSEPPCGGRHHPADQRQDNKEKCWWNGLQLTQTLDAVLHKGQMMPEKKRFPVIWDGRGLCSRASATKTVIAQYAEWTTASADVLDLLRTKSMSTAKQMESSGRGVFRRMIPMEIERAFGFPDDYTAIEYRGKPAADSPRYKVLGNSMAVNVMSWIGQRIDQQEVTDAQ